MLSFGHKSFLNPHSGVSGGGLLSSVPQYGFPGRISILWKMNKGKFIGVSEGVSEMGRDELSSV